MSSNVFALEAYSGATEGQGYRRNQVKSAMIVALDEHRVRRQGVIAPVVQGAPDEDQLDDDEFFAELQDALDDFALRHPTARNWH